MNLSSVNFSSLRNPCLCSTKEIRTVSDDELEFHKDDGCTFLRNSYLLSVKISERSLGKKELKAGEFELSEFLRNSHLLSMSNLGAVPGDKLKLCDCDGGMFLGIVPGEEEPDDGEDETDAAIEIEDERPTVVQRDLTQER